MLNMLSRIIYTDPMQTNPNDSLYGLQWGLRNTGQSGGADGFDPPTGTAGRDINAQVAWDSQTGSAATIVAVIDTGLDWDHPDIAANVWSNTSEASGISSFDDDTNGFVDDLRGWDFGDSDNDPDDTCFNPIPIFDAGGHGTHVSGIVGAVGNNSIGVSGVNWTVSLMPLKVADSLCAIDTSSLANAIAYAASNGAKIINMSLGGSASSPVESAINAADVLGVLSIASAGNSDTSDTSGSYPAAYTNVMAVVATDRNDQRSSFSNYGTWTAISAPGTAIYSTLPVSDGSYG